MRIIDDLAAMKPLWEPGTRHGYHGITYGWLMGEIIRRVTGKSVGTLLADEVAGPLDLDLWIGLPAEEEHRVAPLRPPLPPGADAPEPVLAAMGEIMRPGSLAWRTLTVNGALEFATQAEVNNTRGMQILAWRSGTSRTSHNSPAPDPATFSKPASSAYAQPPRSIGGFLLRRSSTRVRRAVRHE
jgi:hypothetical protein